MGSHARILPNRIWPELVFHNVDRKTAFGQNWYFKMLTAFWPNRIFNVLAKFSVVVVVVPGCCLLVPVVACWCLLVPFGACWWCVCVCVWWVWWVCSRFVGLPVPPDHPSPGPPKISLLFLSLPPEISVPFLLFFFFFFF